MCTLCERVRCWGRTLEPRFGWRNFAHRRRPTFPTSAGGKLHDPSLAQSHYFREIGCYEPLVGDEGKKIICTKGGNSAPRSDMQQLRLSRSCNRTMHGLHLLQRPQNSVQGGALSPRFVVILAF